MIHDPFYRQIISRLEGPLDPELFEQCAAALLRTIYPTLVPMRGGADSGMDGAIADGEGEPFPLVTTTSKKVIGNLTRNLESYLRDRGKRRKVVLATSQALTPRRKRNLYDRAEKLGFTLINVYGQDAIANLLYRDPKWCRELLNLTGDPPALSVVPRTERPLLNQELIGREADLSWLRQISDDSLLVGQPGSGKTFLLYKLAMEGVGLFVISTDRGEIAGGIRSEQPSILIVDDASVNRELLVGLRQMREELGAEFSILASCWPGDKEEIAHTLNLSESRIRCLDLLTRDEIVEVIKATGVYRPNELVREIVNQAEGRPGLAVTLAHLCLQGGVRQVALGDALSGSLLRFFEPVIDQTAREVLAAFSVSGDAGMSMSVVANNLGLNLLDVRRAVVRLAAGGVILDVGQRYLSVRPPALRHALVRDVFFKGAMSLPIEQLLRLLARAPDLSEASRTLMGAKARGAAMPQELLTAVLERIHSPDLWKEFAWLGHDEAGWILRSHPEMLVSIARPALQRAPEIAVPLLLEKAIGDERQLHSTPEHPLRLIGDWIAAGFPGTGEALRRRSFLLDSSLSWLSEGRDTRVGFRALKFVLSPSFGDHALDPGSGSKVTIHRGYLLMDETLAVQGLWPRVLDAIKTVGITDWRPVRDTVEAWAYPGRVNVNIPSELYEAIRAFGGQMLRDVVSLAKDRPGIRHWAKQTAEHVGLELEIPLDEDFEILYPLRDFDDLDDWKIAEAKQRHAARELANEWGQMAPVLVAKRIAVIEQEARWADIRWWSRWTSFVCTEIAKNTDSPGGWVWAMIDADVTSDLVGPFLWKAAETGEPGWMELVADCLDRPALRSAAISLVLTLPTPPEGLLSNVLVGMEGYASLVSTLCLRNQVSEGVLKRLLQHEDAAIASAAVWGEWGTDPEGTVRDSLGNDWREAVINHVIDDYWLGRALENDPLLAFDWLQARLREQYPLLFAYGYERAIKAAVSALDIEARRQAFCQVPETYEMAGLVACLVDENLDLYRELLSNERLKLLHLAPLSGYPEGKWVEMAKLALDAGYSSKEVALAVYGVLGLSVEWVGSESKMWTGWVERFDRLCSYEDERIRKVGEAGRAYAKGHLEHALAQERGEAIYGMR